jgi:hypothetical protein
MRFGTWNVRSLYRSGSLMTVARELARYKLELVGVQEVRWDKGGTVRAGDYTFFHGKGSESKVLFQNLSRNGKKPGQTCQERWSVG